MAFDAKRSVYEIVIEVGGKLKQSLGAATSGANKHLSGMAATVDKMSRATSSLNKLISGAMIFKGASIVANGLISVSKSAISAASEMETYRTTLNTVLRDEEKAADMMRWASEFAATTPYNTGDIVDAVTRLEAYGFKSQVMLENIGNMASAMGKDLPTAVEAVYKATLGEMELMENNFAITKKLINEKAQEWYGQAVVDASKKITDTEMYTNTLLRLIEEKFEGGMEAQSKTWAGIKSNMEDSRDAIFRRIVGMDAAGEATEGGLYARMLRMGQTAADYLSELADSDALDTFADRIGDTVDHLLKKFPDIVEAGKSFGEGLLNAYDGADKLFQTLSGGKPILTALSELFDSVVLEGVPYALEKVGDSLSDIADSAKALGAGNVGESGSKAASAVDNAAKAVLGEDNMISFAGKQMLDDAKTFFSIIGERAQAMGLFGPAQPAGTTNVTVNVTTTGEESDYKTGDIIADRVRSAVEEVNHQNKRLRLQTAK